MRMDAQMTTKSREALQTAANDVVARHNNQVEPAHLVAALLKQPDSLASSLLSKVGADPQAVLTAIESVIGGFPTVSGTSVSQPSLSRAGDRKSTRLNSSHAAISYAVFCLKKKRR